VLRDAAAGDVCEGVDEPRVDQRADGLEVAAVDAEQDLGDAPTAPRERIVRPEAQPIEQEAAEERVAVGVEAAGREADELVPRLHAVRARTAVLLDHADDETGEVVLARRVE